jgi:hypothetical protein
MAFLYLSLDLADTVIGGDGEMGGRGPFCTSTLPTDIDGAIKFIFLLTGIFFCERSFMPTDFIGELAFTGWVAARGGREGDCLLSSGDSCLLDFTGELAFTG